MVRKNSDEAQHSEEPALKQLVAMGYTYISSSHLNNERNKTSEVLLYKRLRDAIRRINPDLDDDGVEDAINKIKEDSFSPRSSMIDINEQIRAMMVGLSQTGGLEPITVDQHDQTGTIKKTVNLFDFENIHNNDFVVTNQFKLQGYKSHICPDIVLFVNGIPLVVIECKAPTNDTWLADAVEENFKKYRSAGHGYEKLMFYNHLLVVTCGIRARYGMISSDLTNFTNGRWSSAYPLTSQKIKDAFGRSEEQEILIAGMFDKFRLLDMLKNYVLYQTINNKKIKIIAKHQQYRAVTKCAEKIQTANTRHGGVIWHTQGSGKSFTMQWVAKQAKAHENTPLVIVTDRLQLDKQIHDTFAAVGYPNPTRAETSAQLANFVRSPKGKTIMTTIQKFEEIVDTTDEKIVVLVDEAHRSQFGVGASAMDTVMPNGIYFGFTGTPIDRDDKSVYQVFGGLIDKYGFEESKSDGATIPIMYEGRLPNLFVEGDESLDALFEKIIGSEEGMTQELKEKLKTKYVTKARIAEAPQRIKKIAFDIVKHYQNSVAANGYKAMIVASSREAAVLYKRELDRLNAPPSKIIMDQQLGEMGKDGTSWDEYYLSDAEKRSVEDSFKLKDNAIKILIVVDMLLVGFDAPIVKVMYLDKSLREHALLQAIARVNRPYDEWKTEGLVVDYYGVTKNIQKALEMFDAEDIRGAWEPDSSQLDELKVRHNNAMKNVKGLTEDLSMIIEAFEPAGKRDRFEADFKRFAKILNSQMYKRESRPYVMDFKKLCRIRQLLKNAYREPNTRLSKYAPMIQGIIDEAIRANSVSNLVRPTECTYESFMAYVSELCNSPKARTAIIKNEAETVIRENYIYDPTYYENLRDLLQRLITEERDRRIDNASYFETAWEEKAKKIYERSLSHVKEAHLRGFGTELEFAMYNQIHNHGIDKDKSAEITKQLYTKLLPETEIVEWDSKPSIQKKMKMMTYDTLYHLDIPEANLEELSESILKLWSGKRV